MISYIGVINLHNFEATQIFFFSTLPSHNTGNCKFSQEISENYSRNNHAWISQNASTGLRIDTGAWDVIGVVVCISCITIHSIIYNTQYERSIYLLLNYIKH